MSSYASPSDLVKYALPPQAVSAIPPSTLQAELDASSSHADDHLRGRGQLPLQTPYPLSLVINVCYHAAFNIMGTRGYNPAAGADALIRKRYEDAQAWFNGVQRQAIHPDFIFSAPPTQDPTYGFPQVQSDAPRGWGTPRGRTPRVG